MRTHITTRMTAAAFMAGTILSGCAHSSTPPSSQNASTDTVFVAEDVCDAIDRPAISSRDYFRNRPDDFYALCFARDQQVCAAAQEHLNDYQYPQKGSSILDRLVIFAIGESFWPSRMSIPSRGDAINADKLDIFNDGKLYAVFQDRVGFGGVQTPHLFVHGPHISIEDNAVNLELFRSARSFEESSQNGTIYPLNLRPIFPSEYWWTGSSVAKVNGENYVAFYASADSFPVGRVAIVKMSDRRNGEYVCKFQSRYQVSKNP